MTEINDDAIITAMLTYGGSFVKALGKCWLMADDHNHAKLKAAFPEYWGEYAALAARKAGKSCR